ncbi:hypothetical protein CBR_g4877 [Chara braunii]|uniref:(S)-ureidoglycine aminohydrolase cupin domain-containing protein n=1 Tax=Chara braunii TaxID=69332 RepID=A0A388KJ37_CHABU|nr:hypothetical protein CBR_g4877 [Chara braunii]|eukprot:GBG70049.1 hypothetical protein CBR_g4877 [Chara braunii]
MECAVRPTHLPALASNLSWRQQTTAQSVSDTIFSARVQSCPVSSSSGGGGPSTSRTAGCTVNANGRWRGRENWNSAAAKAVASCCQQRRSFAVRLSMFPNREEDCTIAARLSMFPNREEDCTSLGLVCRTQRLARHQWRTTQFCSAAAAKLMSHSAGPKLSYGAAAKLSYGAAPELSHSLGVAVGERWIQSKGSSGCNDRSSATSRVLSAAKRGSALQPRLDPSLKLGRSYAPAKAINGDEEEEEYEIDEEELEREGEAPFVPPTGGVYGRPSVEKLFNLEVERPSEERLEELHVSKWSKWESGRTFWAWEWKVDELCFIEKGELEITPRESTRSAVFKAGDLVTFPKWLRARCEVREPLEMRYRFRAIGDAVGIES